MWFVRSINNIRSYVKNIFEVDLNRFLSIDFGQKIIGLATYFEGCDPFPTPYGRIVYKNDHQVLDQLRSIVENEQINTLILGVPYYLDGKSSKMTELIKSFGASLENTFPELKVIYQDETLSSYEAEDRMKKDPRYNFQVKPKEIDALAASIILEDYLKENKC